MKATAAVIHAYGHADALSIEDVTLPAPAPGELQIKQTAIGVNFVDIYHRMGLYPLPSFPAALGVEAAGVIEAIGEGVSGFHIGQRIAYTGLVGAYTTHRNVPAARAVVLPDSVADEVAAASLLKGITAHMLLAHVHRVQPGDTVFIHAAAGGLGLILVQWAKSLGAHVIGTVGSHAKADLARSFGLDHAILYKEEDFVATTLALTQQRGVDFAIDGVGGSTLLQTLKIVRPFGMTASIGQAAGAIDPININILAGGCALSRPSVFRFISTPSHYQEGAAMTLQKLQTGLRIHIGKTLPLKEASAAHQQLESGQTSGILVLKP